MEASTASSYFLGESPPRQALADSLGSCSPCLCALLSLAAPTFQVLGGLQGEEMSMVTQGGHMLPKLCRSFSQGNKLIGKGAKPEGVFYLSECLCVCLSSPSSSPPSSSLSTFFLLSLATQRLARTPQVLVAPADGWGPSCHCALWEGLQEDGRRRKMGLGGVGLELPHRPGDVPVHPSRFSALRWPQVAWPSCPGLVLD